MEKSNLIHVLASLADYYFKHIDSAALDAIKHHLSTLTTDTLGVHKPTAGMEYYSIYESNLFHMNILVLNNGTTIPLHDHPGMTVLSCLIYGTIETETYEWLSSRDSLNPSSNKAAIVNQKSIDASSSESFMTIYSNYGPSMHSFKCISDYAVILDILGPPYGENRICTYYKINKPIQEPDGSAIVTLEPFDYEDENVIEHIFKGDKIRPKIFSKTAINILKSQKSSN